MQARVDALCSDARMKLVRFSDVEPPHEDDYANDDRDTAQHVRRNRQIPLCLRALLAYKRNNWK